MIRGLRYANDDNFWPEDLDTRMVMPPNAALQGKGGKPSYVYRISVGNLRRERLEKGGFMVKSVPLTNTIEQVAASVKQTKPDNLIYRFAASDDARKHEGVPAIGIYYRL